eukprot:1142707-Pelagomonas_calceolata.AAC.9
MSKVILFMHHTHQDIKGHSFHASYWGPQEYPRGNMDAMHIYKFKHEYASTCVREPAWILDERPHAQVCAHSTGLKLLCELPIAIVDCDHHGWILRLAAAQQAGSGIRGMEHTAGWQQCSKWAAAVGAWGEQQVSSSTAGWQQL